MITGKMKFKMTGRQAINKINDWLDVYIGNVDDVILKFSNKMSVGTGSMEYEKTGICRITVGIYPYRENGPAWYGRITELDFTRISVDAFHEMGHYVQNISDNTEKEILLSSVSVYNNPQYYRKCWNVMPHEIDAEYTGVMGTWNNMRSAFGDQADNFLYEYLDYKCSNTIYMIPSTSFQSREQVDSLFESAYGNSLNGRRHPPNDFLQYQDETAQLLTDDYHNLRTEYVPIFNKLMTAQDGRTLDRMMASLVSYMHPELRDKYPQLDFRELNPSHVFGMQMPELPEEIAGRLAPIDNDILFNTMEYPMQPDREFEEAMDSIPSSGPIQL